MNTRKCKFCEKEFEVLTQKNKIFCNDSCKRNFYRKEKNSEYGKEYYKKFKENLKEKARERYKKMTSNTMNTSYKEKEILEYIKKYDCLKFFLKNTMMPKIYFQGVNRRGYELGEITLEKMEKVLENHKNINNKE